MKYDDFSIAYVGSPYSHRDPAVREERWRLVVEACADLIEMGITVFSPIAHAHPIAISRDLDPGFEFWRDFDLAMIERTSEFYVLCLKGWDASSGLAAEIDYARSIGHTVKYVTPIVDSQPMRVGIHNLPPTSDVVLVGPPNA